MGLGGIYKMSTTVGRIVSGSCWVCCANVWKMPQETMRQWSHLQKSTHDDTSPTFVCRNNSTLVFIKCQHPARQGQHILSTNSCLVTCNREDKTKEKETNKKDKVWMMEFPLTASTAVYCQFWYLFPTMGQRLGWWISYDEQWQASGGYFEVRLKLKSVYIQAPLRFLIDTFNV